WWLDGIVAAAILAAAVALEASVRRALTRLPWRPVGVVLPDAEPAGDAGRSRRPDQWPVPALATAGADTRGAPRLDGTLAPRGGSEPPRSPDRPDWDRGRLRG
ncbi:MAG: hypothetical protein KDB10_21680, partial [Acidimicrobiales bacterium]|nr:hypothetical protein [Acidimicrobiales bacterium]